LIRAYASAKRDFRLVLAGMRGFHAQRLEALIAELGADVKLTGWIPREELYGLYAAAHAFIYPSTFEGFGMPVLEAMAAGIPVACSDIPPLREIAGDAALMFDPENQDEIGSALGRIVTDDALRSRLAAAGPPRARQFSWDGIAGAILDSLRQAVAQSRV
jgi:glycosyltransferase involved in cell wall biosynthesis